MQTQVIADRTTATPWLEVESRAGGPPERILLTSVPFIIGRGDTADYQVKSTRVSREHAVIVRQESTYLLRDLGSTNGSLVNGVRTKEIALNDGDQITLGDMQFTFTFGDVAPRNMATQVMDRPDETVADSGAGRRLIDAVRRLHESVVQRGGRIAFEPIVALESREIVGVEAASLGVGGEDGENVDKLVRAADARSAAHWRRLARRWALEEAEALPEHWFLCLTLDALDLQPDVFAAELEQVQRSITGRRTIVWQMAENAIGDHGDLAGLRRQLHDVGMQVGICEFAAGRAGVSHYKKAPPDLVKLAASATRGAEQAGNRHRQLASAVRALRDMQCHVVAAGIDAEATATACREWGCQLGQGPLLGAPRGVSELVPSLPRRTGPKPAAVAAASANVRVSPYFAHASRP